MHALAWTAIAAALVVLLGFDLFVHRGEPATSPSPAEDDHSRVADAAIVVAIIVTLSYIGLSVLHLALEAPARGASVML